MSRLAGKLLQKHLTRFLAKSRARLIAKHLTAGSHGALFAVFLCCLTACGFVDLRPVQFSLYPPEPDDMLPEAYSAVSVTFSTDMEQQEVERALAITSKEGTIEGDRYWEGSKLVFVPLSPWKAGIRYNLALNGLVHARDGRELRLSVNHPFYGLCRGEQPVLLSVDPSSGGTVPVQALEPPLPGAESSPHGPPISLRFSRPMNRLSVQDALKIEGVDQLAWIWTEDDRNLLLIPYKSLSPWTVYRWSLKKTAAARDGIPLGREESGTFCTTLDTERPRVERTFTLAPAVSGWTDLGRGPGDLDIGQALGVRFSKPMNRDSLLQAVRIEPSLSGYAVQIDAQTVAWVPDRPPEPETTYVLVVAGDTRDTSGLTLEGEYRESFIPAIPYLQLESLEADGSSPVTGPFPPVNPQVYTIHVAAPEGLVSINLHFSHPFDSGAQTGVIKMITLSPYFPGSLAPVALRAASWVTDSTLRLVWEGLEAGSGGITNYYRLTLTGGRSGLSTRQNGIVGYWLKDTVNLYLEAQP